MNSISQVSCLANPETRADALGRAVALDEKQESAADLGAPLLRAKRSSAAEQQLVRASHRGKPPAQS